jgi:hypothetical protein
MARVEGFEPAKSDQEPADGNGNPVSVGVWGDSSTGVGVLGTNGALQPNVNNIPTNIAGVEGHSLQNPGVFGRSILGDGVSGESEQGLGILGISTTGTGVVGITSTPSIPDQLPDASGVAGFSNKGGNGVVGSATEADGVVGNSNKGNGVRAISRDGNGVQAETISKNGVLGVSESSVGINGITIRGATGVSGIHLLSEKSEDGQGVGGFSFTRTGVQGVSLGGTGVLGRGSKTGVHGIVPVNEFFDPNASGIIGENLNSKGLVLKGLAGLFLGNVRITGSLSKAGGGFEIDHPLTPGNKYLRHSFVESPDMLNVYNGNVTTDANGEACVALPDYFEALNQEFRYQLTVIGQFAQAIVAQEIMDNQFTIKTDQPQIKVSWQVIGIRQDPWAAANRITVEEEKADEQKGRFLHPEVWDQPEELRIHRSALPENQQNQMHEDYLRQISQLMPEQFREQIEQRLRTLLQSDHVDYEELQSLLEELSETNRTRLEKELRQMEEFVQRIHPMTQK